MQNVLPLNKGQHLSTKTLLTGTFEDLCYIGATEYCPLHSKHRLHVCTQLMRTSERRQLSAKLGWAGRGAN